MAAILLSSLFFWIGCTEYDLHSRGDGEGGTDTASDNCLERSDGPASIASNEDCVLEAETGQFYPEVQWTMDSFAEHPMSRSVMATPMVAHITDDDGDGVFGSQGDLPDIAVVTYGDVDVLRVISGDGSRVHWSSAAVQVQGQSQPAVGDIDGDGAPEIVVATYSNTGKVGVAAFNHDGSVLWTTGERYTSQIGGRGSGDMGLYCTAVALADMDGDGTVEVIAGRLILQGSTGAELGLGSFGIGQPIHAAGVGTTSFAVDIDLDGDQEVIVGNAFYDIDGSPVNISPNLEDGYVAVANFDDDDEGEIVVVRDGTVTVYHHDWSVLWGPTNFGSSWGGPPTVADFDGDGKPEIGVAGQSIYSMIDDDGRLVWTRVVSDETSGVTGSSVFDFEGDGIAEVVYADENRLWVFNGPDGAVKLESDLHTSNTWLENPVIADVDGDGAAEIVYGHNVWQGPGTDFYGISVVADQSDTWMTTREIWNQHAYSITNIQDDGSIPRSPEINWLSYNNFRSADIFAGTGSNAPDLVPEIVDVCEENCSATAGEIWLWARVRNEGAARTVSTVTLTAVSGGATLDTVDFEDSLAPGQTTETVKFILWPDDFDSGVSLRADVADVECDDGNNQTGWNEPVCVD